MKGAKGSLFARLLFAVFLLFAVSAPSVFANICPIYTTEGQLVQITAEGYDPDSDIGPAGMMIWSYPMLFDEQGRWQSRVGDAGVYHLTFGLSDGEFSDSYTVCMEVFAQTAPIQPRKMDFNNAPLLFGLKNIKMYVGDTLHLRISCVDVDGDGLDLTYHGWPSERDHTATYEEIGTHVSDVVCTDSRGAETRQQMTIQVLPRSAAPVILFDHLTVYEGDVIDLRHYVYDLDTPVLRYEATGIFETSLVWHTMRGDAGNYSTDLSVSDGQSLVSRHVSVEVLERPLENIDINYPRAPEFEDVGADDFVMAEKKQDPVEIEEKSCHPHPPCDTQPPCKVDCDINIVIKAVMHVKQVLTGPVWSASSPENRC